MFFSHLWNKTNAHTCFHRWEKEKRKIILAELFIFQHKRENNLNQS